MKRRFTAFTASLALAGGMFVAVAGASSAATVPGAGSWTPTSNGLSLVRNASKATTLPDGRVLVEGGFVPGAYTNETEIYDPATNAWTVASPMHYGRGEQSATLLKDGRVLVAGGYAGPVLYSAEIFDPSTGQWQVTGSMHVNRTRFAAVRLCDGRVLAVGGWNGYGISSAEIYDPATGLWTLTAGSLPAPLQEPDAILLPDCTVLIAGGAAGEPNPTATAAAYIFHPDTGVFTAAASMHYPRVGQGIAPLPDGRILVMGGDPASSSTTAEVFNPATDQWSDVAPMHDPHIVGEGEIVQVLPDGRVFVPGDTANGLEAELYDPATSTWSFTAPQNAVHYNGVTALLHDGRVLNAGGSDSAGTLTAVGEIYTPTSDSDLAIATPAGVTANATSSTGANVSYPLPAVTDPDDPTAPAPGCSPAPGSVFGAGTTTVTCTASDPDDANSLVTTSFTITVKGAAAQLAGLYQAVQGVGTGTSLAGKIALAQSEVTIGDLVDAFGTLDAFVNEVSAQMGKSIPAHQASQLIADARRIQTAMGTYGWADYSFCGSYGVPAMGASYYGVAACGYAYPNNYQGKISYHGVEFDSVGFQCAELAARYFYYVTGQKPPLPADGSEFAHALSGTSYGYNVYPADIIGGTSTFQPSLAPGQIISMWSSSDQVGHVGVVTTVNVSGGKGTITVMDENGSGGGTDIITVSAGQMYYGNHLYNDFQWTTNLPS